MRGADLAEAMALAVDRIVSAREGANALDRAVEAVVGTIGQFNGRNATDYLEAYRAEMVMRDIPEDRRLSRFPRVAIPGIHADVLEVWEECGTWEEFEGRPLEKYGHDDALRLSKRDFMEWVETPGKGRSASALLRDFEERFARLSTLDRTVSWRKPSPGEIDGKWRIRRDFVRNGSVENQAQRRQEGTAESTVCRIGVNRIRPVRTYG